MKNEKIRKELKQNGVFLWQVAKALGVSEFTLVRWMREELPENKQEEILNIIKQEGTKK